MSSAHFRYILLIRARTVKPLIQGYFKRAISVIACAHLRDRRLDLDVGVIVIVQKRGFS
jgi:hypothetical protein